MNQALNNWLNTMRQDLEANGINATVINGQQANSYGVNLDSKKFVGGVFYWPEGTYEGHLYLFVDWHLAPKGHKKVQDFQ
jgi:hypothetical protein